MVSIPAWPILQIGSTGSNVIALQYLLNSTGLNLVVNGFFSPEMDSDVKSFQKAHGLEQTGKTSEALFKVLISDVRSAKKPEFSLVAEAAQQLLNKFNSNLDVDGKFGPASVKALVTFQLRMNMSISGIVDTDTWQFLFGYDRYPADAVLPSPPSTKAYASICQYPSTLTNSQKNVNAALIFKFLTESQGCNGRAACAILGNMQNESGIDPGAWEVMSNTSRGYGLVQWTPATNFLYWAYTNKILPAPLNASALATASNNLAAKQPEKLMDAELDYLMFSLEPSQGNFFPSEYVPFPELGIKTFNGFKTSEGTVAQLTEVFARYYERPADVNAGLQNRINYAEAWAKYFGVKVG